MKTIIHRSALYRTRSYEETMRDEIAWLIAEGKIRGASRPRAKEMHVIKRPLGIPFVSRY